MADVQNRPRLRESIAGEIRVAMVRRQVTGAALAQALGKSQAYVSRRLSGETAFDTDDLEVIAGALRVSVADLVGHAERGDGAYVADSGEHPIARYAALADVDLDSPPTLNYPPGLPLVPGPRARPTLRALQTATANSLSTRGV